MREAAIARTFGSGVEDSIDAFTGTWFDGTLLDAILHSSSAGMGKQMSHVWNPVITRSLPSLQLPMRCPNCVSMLGAGLAQVAGLGNPPHSALLLCCPADVVRRALFSVSSKGAPGCACRREGEELV